MGDRVDATGFAWVEGDAFGLLVIRLLRGVNGVALLEEDAKARFIEMLDKSPRTKKKKARK